jgi:hypothetical protein
MLILKVIMKYLLERGKNMKLKRFVHKILKKTLSYGNRIKKKIQIMNSKSITIRTDEFFLQQKYKNQFNRFDTIIRLLAIENFYEKNNYGWNLYKKMQSKRISPQYSDIAVSKFKELILSWSEVGYKKESKIVCDNNLQLIDGSHRLALSIYFNNEFLNCKVYPWSETINYGIDWFLENDFSLDDMNLIQAKYNEVYNRYSNTISCVLWPPVFPYFDEITELIKYKYSVSNIKDLTFKDETFERAVKGIYYLDDISDTKIDKKIEYMKDFYPKTIRIMNVKFDDPQFRLKAFNNSTISKEGEILKKIIRNNYKLKIDNYFHDIIVHTGDNFKQSEFISHLFDKIFSLEDYFNFLNKNKFLWMLIKYDSDYLTEDFPKSYPFSKDSDILCAKNQFKDIIRLTNKYLNLNVKKGTKLVKVIKNECRVCFRLEKEGFLIYQLDISSTYDNLLSNSFCNESIHRRSNFNNCFYIPKISDELCFRIVEYYNFPKKIKHLKYIKSHLSSVDYALLEDNLSDKINYKNILLKAEKI